MYLQNPALQLQEKSLTLHDAIRKIIVWPLKKITQTDCHMCYSVKPPKKQEHQDQNYCFLNLEMYSICFALSNYICFILNLKY